MSHTCLQRMTVNVSSRPTALPPLRSLSLSHPHPVIDNFSSPFSLTASSAFSLNISPLLPLHDSIIDILVPHGFLCNPYLKGTSDCLIVPRHLLLTVRSNALRILQQETFGCGMRNRMNGYKARGILASTYLQHEVIATERSSYLLLFTSRTLYRTSVLH